MSQSAEKSLEEIRELLAGTLNVAQRSDFGWAVARDELQGISPQNVIGFNPLTALTEVTIWSSATRYVVPTGAETLNIVSDSGDDDGDPAGIGAQRVRVIGLGAALEPISEIVVLNGVGNVLTNLAYRAVNSLVLTAAGSTHANVGTLLATQSVSGLVLNCIGPALSLSRSCLFTVPAGKEFIPRRLSVIPGELAGPTGFMEFHVYAHQPTTGIRLGIRVGHATTVIDEPIEAPANPVIAGTTFECTGFVDAGSTSAEIRVAGFLADARV